MKKLFLGLIALGSLSLDAAIAKIVADRDACNNAQKAVDGAQAAYGKAKAAYDAALAKLIPNEAQALSQAQAALNQAQINADEQHACKSKYVGFGSDNPGFSTGVIGGLTTG